MIINLWTKIYNLWEYCILITNFLTKYIILQYCIITSERATKIIKNFICDHGALIRTYHFHVVQRHFILQFKIVLLLVHIEEAVPNGIVDFLIWDVLRINQLHPSFSPICTGNKWIYYYCDQINSANCLSIYYYYNLNKLRTVLLFLVSLLQMFFGCGHFCSEILRAIGIGSATLINHYYFIIQWHKRKRVNLLLLIMMMMRYIGEKK